MPGSQIGEEDLMLQTSIPKCPHFSSAQVCALKLNWDWSSEISILICETGMKETKALAAQSCPTLWDPMDGSPPGSSVRGILQARILDWVVICFSRDLPDPGIKPRSPAVQVDSSPAEPTGKPETRIMPSYLLISHGSWYECWGMGIKRDG